MSVGMFDTLTSGDQERQITAERYQDKIAAATYDVRQRHGDWLFGASDINGFNDRVAMSFNSICHTIEPHLHARTGVAKRVIKNLEQEWRRRQADMPGAPLPAAEGGGSGSLITGPEETGVKPLSPATLGDMRNNVQNWNSSNLASRQRQACYPGCEKNEAHAKKFHKDKGEKDARRRQAAEDGAYERSQPDHPEMHIQKTFQDHQGEELIPEGNFDAYKDRVDQGAQSKVDHAFIPGEHDQRHEEDGSHNFVPTVTGRRHRAGEEKGQGGNPDNRAQDNRWREEYERENGSDYYASREYQHLARMLYAADTTGMDPNAQVGGGAMGTAGAAPTPAGGGAPPVTPPAAGGGDLGGGADLGSLGGGAPPLATPPPGGPPPVTTASREYQVMRQMLAAPLVAPGMPGAGSAPGDGGIGPSEGNPNIMGPGIPGGGASTGGPPANGYDKAGVGNVAGQALTGSRKAHSWAVKVIQDQGTLAARQRLLAAARQVGALTEAEYDAFAPVFANRRKLADRNYLQQADEAITKVLNEKAEEFQNTIAPLQQALITIQQAEQLQNPLNVSPPAGTVNVLPQQGGTDPNAAAGGGGAPQAPQGAGGLGADPAAAGLAGQQPPPQQVQASWYTQPKTRPRQASRGRRPLADRRQADVGDAWNSWSQNHTNRGDDSTYQQFAQDKGYATPDNPRAKAIPTLQGGGSSGITTTPSGGTNRGMPKKPKGAPALTPTKPIKQVKGPGYGVAASRRQGDHAPEPGYIWSKAPSSVKGEFMNRVGSGITPDQAFKQMIAEITDHHAKGLIGGHDAHRAANEAFGRLLLSRRRQAVVPRYEDDADVPEHLRNWAPHSQGKQNFVNTGRPVEDMPVEPSSRGRRPLGVGG